MFHVGQLVVCVDDDLHERYMSPGYAADRLTLGDLRRGTVYTIRATGGHESCVCPMVWLDEIRRPPSWGLDENGYAAARFRPVDETKLSIFKAMLVSPPKETVTIGQD